MFFHFVSLWKIGKMIQYYIRGPSDDLKFLVETV